MVFLRFRYLCCRPSKRGTVSSAASHWKVPGFDFCLSCTLSLFIFSRPSIKYRYLESRRELFVIYHFQSGVRKFDSTYRGRLSGLLCSVVLPFLYFCADRPWLIAPAATSWPFIMTLLLEIQIEITPFSSENVLYIIEFRQI